MTLDPARDARTRAGLEAHGLDALVCRLPENVLLLTGYWPTSSFAFGVVPRQGRVVLIVVDTELADVPEGAADEVRSYGAGILSTPEPLESIERHLRDVLRAMDLERGRIGIEMNFELVAAGHTGGDVLLPSAPTMAAIGAAAPDAAVVDAGPMLEEARARKTPYEIDKLRRANAVAAFGLNAFRQLYEVGRTEAEIAAGVEAAIRSRGIGFEGAAHVRAWAQLMTGARSSQAYSLHPTTSARVVQEGDLGVLELGTSVDGYWSDLTRTLVPGRPSERQSELYGALTAAVDAVLAAGRPGMSAQEIDGLAREEVKRRGFAELFFHPTGHGLGFRYHEAHPLLKPGNGETIEQGMVSSVEPGLYHDSFGGMRLEQNVVFTEDAVDVLSDFPAELER